MQPGRHGDAPITALIPSPRRRHKDVDLADPPDRPAANQLDDAPVVRLIVHLDPELRHAPVYTHPRYEPRLLNRMCQRLLAVHVPAGSRRRQRHPRVHVIRGRDDDRVHVLLLQHPPVVGVHPRPRISVRRLCQHPSSTSHRAVISTRPVATSSSVSTAPRFPAPTTPIRSFSPADEAPARRRRPERRRSGSQKCPTFHARTSAIPQILPHPPISRDDMTRRDTAFRAVCETSQTKVPKCCMTQLNCRRIKCHPAPRPRYYFYDCSDSSTSFEPEN